MIGLENVSFSYPEKGNVLHGLDLHIAEGEFVCILGANGSGKSTLAKLIAGALSPSTGRVTINGLDVTSAAKLRDAHTMVGLVMQNPENQLVASLVEDEVAFGPENLGLESASIRRRVTWALQQVALSGFEPHAVASLSGGQKQRLAIAGILAMQPRIIVLDEASSMLDPQGRKQLMQVCKQLHEQGLTIVMITHFMEEAASAQRLIVLDEGHVATQGKPEDILTQKSLLESLSLEQPFAVQLAEELRRQGLDIAPCCTNEQIACALLRLKEADR